MLNDLLEEVDVEGGMEALLGNAQLMGMAFEQDQSQLANQR